MSSDPFQNQSLNEIVTQLTTLILTHDNIVQKFIIPVAEHAIDLAEQNIVSIEGKGSQPKLKHIESVGVVLARSVAAKALIKHAEEQLKELEEIRLDTLNTATHEFLSGPTAANHLREKGQGLVSKCHKYGCDLLNELVNVNRDKATEYKEKEAVLKRYLESDDNQEKSWLRTVLEWGQLDT
jgi:hypothetical protein